MKRLLEQAAQSRFYRERPVNSWSEVAVTTKADLRAAYPFDLLAVPLSKVSTYHESSGSTGQPISSYFTDADWEDIVSRFLRNDVKLGPGDLVMVKTPYALVTTGHQMHLAARAAGATVVPADNRSSNMPYSRVARLLRDLPITVTWSLPSEAFIWAFVAKRLGHDLTRDFPQLRAFLVAGESLSPTKKRALSTLWGGKRVLEDYGSTETGSLAGECASGRLHLWSDRVLFEVRDEKTGVIASRGSGTLLVTPLFREAMPLLRYELGDQVRIENGCACGSELPTVEVSGRQGSGFIIDGHEVYARDLEEAVYADFEETEVFFWRARARADRVSLEVYAESSQASELIKSRIEHVLGIRSEVRAMGWETFLSPAALAAETPMQKPKFVFSETEDWNQGLSYAKELL